MEAVVEPKLTSAKFLCEILHEIESVTIIVRQLSIRLTIYEASYCKANDDNKNLSNQATHFFWCHDPPLSQSEVKQLILMGSQKSMGLGINMSTPKKLLIL